MTVWASKERISAAGGVWGLLAYSTGNLGDDLQSLAALQYLPGTPLLLDRDDISVPDGAEFVSLIANAWWTHYPERLLALPCNRFDPLLVAVHVAQEGIQSESGTTMNQILETHCAVEALRERHPVGCRDRATLGLMQRLGVDSYLSGCLTTTLEAPPTEGAPEPYDLYVDLPPGLSRRLAVSSPVRTELATNDIPADLRGIERLVRAEFRLRQIRDARAVVTTRLHVALPALAMGTPVVVVREDAAEGRLDTFREWVDFISPSEICERVKEFESSGWPSSLVDPVAQMAGTRERVKQWVTNRSGVRGLDVQNGLPLTRSRLQDICRERRDELLLESRRDYERLAAPLSKRLRLWRSKTRLRPVSLTRN